MDSSAFDPLVAVRVPETKRRNGYRYAITDDGVELAIIDVTQPGCAPSLGAAEQRAGVVAFVREQRRLAKLPGFLRRGLLTVLARKSFLARAIGAAENTFASGMTTYLLKLGPDLLPSALAQPIDRQVASALPALDARLRLLDMARLIEDAVVRGLSADRTKRPLSLINIAGGPAMDSLNAILLLARDHPDLIEGRAISIEVLDLDGAGPNFGARALAQMMGHGGPLQAYSIGFRATHYDWTQVSQLTPVLDRAREDNALIIVSSEGGLFEYGTDRDIVSNLVALRSGAGADLVVAGSVTRNDEPARLLRETGRVATRPRGLQPFRELAQSAGLRVDGLVERTFCDSVTMVPDSSAGSVCN